MLGTPTDVYLTGAMLFWMPVGFGIGALISAYVYLPLFQDLGILSISQVYYHFYFISLLQIIANIVNVDLFIAQYLELRFHRHVRRLFSAITLFGNVIKIFIF